MQPAVASRGAAVTRLTHTKSPARTTCHDAKGQADGSGGGGVSTCVPHLWRRHPADRVFHGTGPDPEDPHASWRTARAAAGVARSWPAHGVGRTRAGALSIARSSRPRPTICPRSIFTASERRRTPGVEAPGNGRLGRGLLETPEKRPRSGCEAFRETRSGRPGRSSRGSRVAHQPEHRCGGAIDRAILESPPRRSRCSA